jgi:hypothetical protein
MGFCLSESASDVAFAEMLSLGMQCLAIASLIMILSMIQGFTPGWHPGDDAIPRLAK